MKNDISRKSLLKSIPIELHGHKKKTTFFLNSLESYIKDNNYKSSDLAILEIGCSNGSLVTLPIAEGGYNILGIDLHQPSIDAANAANKFDNASFLYKDLVDFDNDEIYDVIILSDILEHVEDPDYLLRLSTKHLSQNGIILISVPNGYGPSELERKFLEKTRIIHLINFIIGSITRLLGRKSSAYNSDSGHIQFFRMKDLQKLYTSSDLVITSFGKGALFGGGITYPFGKILPFIIKPSLWIADKINLNFVSTWYFSLKRNN